MLKNRSNRKERVELQAEEARRAFSECLEDVAFRGKRIVVSRFGKNVMAMVSMEDLAKLEGAA